ncbi:metal ABC transporter permease [Corynebacterium diphtheriae]|uniref:metal ABC transporter permease n=1 Tax=Corynebacterium diphtheriae TaxID=1717 RepID=UPI000892F460|nr:metal ABC transporter permease [Corynebacterium diphtheriae]OFI53910.1 ABC transporter permease [Corynebacterium diphtheriae]OSQ21377.1 ABC transporter permease [Corynebacterium diphtheriae]OWX99420.1 ABC transporter permease [Corynebacterium diphtheriae]CAB0533902.1 metal ABC transporter permease [Corynebacterium diphtheriae]CAB0626435.1 metal ABC transporter permease [Corynebacterium diphtheriae]
MTFAVSVSLLALVVALTAAIPGVVLVLRRQAMLSDALSHAVLPGIAVGALWTTNPNSPILLIGATLSGVLVMALTEWVRGRKRVTEDSATGLIFPAFFAIGVILISTKFNRSSISEHTVLVGDLNISAMQHLVVGTIDFGPKSAWIIGAVGLLTLVLLLVAKRPLAISTFDPVFARTVGIRTRLINYLVMTMVSLTIVVVFDAAGAVLAVALMIVPAATALMIASSEGAMLLVTLVVAAVSSQVGFWVAYRLDAATSPTMAFVDGLIFLAVWGIIRARRRLRR